jgi:hypothetical protein
VRIGRSPAARPWAVAVRQRRFAAWRRWNIALGGDVWQQPPLADDAFDAVAGEARWGAAIRGRVERALVPVWFANTPATFIVEVGAKRAGFIPGEPLRGGVVARAGIGFPF